MILKFFLNFKLNLIKNEFINMINELKIMK